MAMVTIDDAVDPGWRVINVLLNEIVRPDAEGLEVA